ncbi:MAG: nuclear transport factor 2 family protein [Rhizobiaceae bacterium]|nr:nuclear transport factor 2 family protein [Rhizobiaceae bacterium]
MTVTPQLASARFHELADAAQYYLDMLYACDADMVDGIFEKDARLCTLDGNDLVYRSVEQYKDVLRGRVSPSSTNAPREDELISIDLSTPTQALLKLKMRINQLVFIDYLTLIRLEKGWRIVAKTYQRISGE